MALTLKPGANTVRTLVPAESHAARCYSVLDFGTHDVEYKGEKKVARKVRIAWEIPEATVERDGKQVPLAISKTFTMSMHEKATLRSFLKSWRGRDFNAEELKGFDLFRVIGATCLLNVIHETKDGKTYANIASVGPLPKGMTIKSAVNPPLTFSIDDGFGENFNALPDWAKEVVQKSHEYQKHFKGGVEEAPAEEAPAASNPDDDVPF